MKRCFGLRLAALALLLGATGQAGATGNLVSNPGFETGSLSPWTTTSPGVVAVGSFKPNSGSHEADMTQSTTFVNLSQALTTGPGTYNLSFSMLYSGVADQNAEFKASLGGTQAIDIKPFVTDPTGLGAQKYVRYTAVVTTTATNPILEFDEKNRNNFFRLDDVSVTPAVANSPEPSSVALLGMCGMCLGGYTWVRRKKATAIPC